MVDDIWMQPAQGFTDASIGRTEEQIAQKEFEIGFKFPVLYREHMKMQNGGYVWKGALIHHGEVNELFYNDSSIDPITNSNGYKTLKDVMLERMDAEELVSSSEDGFLDLSRLPILSHMDGHTMLCFDYGYKVESEYETPEIVYFELEGVENGFEEVQRLKSYDDLIHHLVYYGYESTTYYIGLKSEALIDKIADNFNNVLDARLELRTDGNYGWYNFERWYSGELKLNPSLSLHLSMSPNQFLSKTYRFQNNKDYDYILDIEFRIGVESLQDNSSYLKTILEKKLSSFLSGLSWDFLLIPFHKDNPEELHKLEKTFES